MSTITRNIAAVEFQANSRQANAAIESMRQEAKKCKDEVAGLQAQLDKGIETTVIEGKNVDIKKRIKELNSMARAFDDAANSQIKGVKAWDELWKHAKLGNIEKLTAQQIKAGTNGGKRIYDRLLLGDEEDRRIAKAMKDTFDQGQIVLDKLKASTEDVIHTIQDGGRVSDETLKREKQYLQDMLNLTEKFSPEWNEYNRQLQAINKAIDEQTAAERRLRGELVDANDARREAEKLDKAEADAARQRYDAQQKIIDAANQEIKKQQDVRREHQAKVDSITEEIAQQDLEIQKQDQIVASINREINARRKSSSAAEREASRAMTYAVNKLTALEKEQGKLDEMMADGQEGTAKYERQQQRVNKAQTEYATALADSEQKSQALDKAEEERLAPLSKEVGILNNLHAQRTKNIGLLHQEQETVNKATAVLDEQAKIVHNAQTEQAKSRQLSIDSIEKAIALLKQENRTIGESDPQWAKNEETIGKLNQRLEEMRQKAAELRGEVMSVGDALKLAYDLSQSEGLRTPQGNATVEEMEKARASLQEALKTTGNPTAIEQINAAIDTLTTKLKEASGEWMSLHDAQKLASEAGTESFVATADQMKQATDALNRQRDALIKTIQQKRVDGEATEHEEQQLKDLEKQLKDLKFEQDNFNMSHAQMERLLKEPKKATDLEELRAAIKRADGELRRLKNSLGENSKAYEEMAEQVKNAKNVMKEMEGQAKASASAWEKAWSRLKTYVGMYMGFNILWGKLEGTMQDVLTLSDKMGEVRKTTGFTADQVGRLSNNLLKLDTRTSITQLMDLSAAAGQLGLQTQEDIQGFTEAANEMLVALPEMGQEGATEMMKIAIATGEVKKIQEQMDEGTIQGSSATAVAMEKVGSTIDRLRATTAAAAPPIADFVKRVGAVGAQSGITVDQVAALGATVDSLGMGTEMAATAISRMIPAIKNNAFDVARAIGVTPNTLRELFDTGRGMEAVLMVLQKMKDADMGPDTIEKMLGETGMQGLMKELDQQGARAGIVFAGLSQNVDLLRENLQTANQAYKEGTAITNEYNKMNDTAAAKWERLKNQMEEFFVNNTTQNWLSTIIDLLRVLVNMLTDNGPFGTFFRSSLIYLALYKAKWAEAIGSAIMSLGSLIFSTKQSTAATVEDTTAKTADAAATETLGNANAAAAAKTNMFSSAWSKLNKVQKANIIAAVAMAVWALGSAIYDAYKKSKDAAKQLDLMTDVEKKAKEESIKERAELRKLYEATQDQTKSMKERKKALHDMVGDEKYNKYYKNLSSETELANSAAKAYHELAEKIIETARARALDAKAEELQRKRIELEDKKTEKEQWRDKNRNNYDKSRKAYQAQQDYVEGATGGLTAGFSESQVARRGAAAQKPAIIDQYVTNENEISNLDSQISDVDADIARLKNQIKTTNNGGNGGGNGNGGGGNGNGGGGTGGGNNPWGDNPDAASTDWKKMSANALVDRRKQMNNFVKALQEDTDVSSVLAEDPALQKAIEKGMSSDMRTVVKWYNEQRLKIQDELHARFLTNTGSWKDPKVAKQRKRSISKMIKDDMSYYLDEVDAYYTQNKSNIEEAQAAGEIDEAEAQRRILQNEQVWYEKRANLQMLYADKAGKLTREQIDSLTAIISERTGEDPEFIEKNIQHVVDFIKKVGEQGEAGKAIAKALWGDLDLGFEKDFLKMNTAVSKMTQAIADIIAKERPFDGLVENLRKNMETMGLLQTDFENRRLALEKKGKKRGDKEYDAIDKEQAEETSNRLTFLLQEAENAYSMTWDKFYADALKDGRFGSWMDALLTGTDDVVNDRKQALLAQLHTLYDSVQDAIKKESSLIKKQVENQWNDAVIIGADGQKTSMKSVYEQAASALGIEESRVSRANSLIGAGAASERVADRLAIKQMEVQLHMQEHYYNLMQKIGLQRVENLKLLAKQKEDEGKINEAKQYQLDAEHALTSLNLSRAEETASLAKLQEEIDAKTEESQNRLYTSLREWSQLLTSSVQSIFEASNTGLGDYYNDLAKMRLTGEGSAGGTYVVIDNAGTKDATAHYETLDGEDALKRQLEIEQQNATADAWKKVMDDINNKMADQITDWMNASMQVEATNENTAALRGLTTAIEGMKERFADEEWQAGITRDENGIATDAEGNVLPLRPQVDLGNGMTRDENGITTDANGNVLPLRPVDVTNSSEQPAETMPTSFWPTSEEQKENMIGWQNELWENHTAAGITSLQEMSEATTDMPQAVTNPYPQTEDQVTSITENTQLAYQGMVDASSSAADKIISNQKRVKVGQQQTDNQMANSSHSTFAKMVSAVNMYGIAYQAMSNDNLNATQKFQMIALQAVGSMAMAGLDVLKSEMVAQAATDSPGVLGKLWKQLGQWAPAVFAVFTGLLGGLMGLATSKISKSKSEIAQTTGANVSAGRLSTGMLTYAEGNVNEFTDPSTLTPGRSYNVDAADGRTYRAKYTGNNPSTHITNGPEFHLAGERGREAIIDAHTTRLLQMDDTGIWRSIQTLYNGGLPALRRHGSRRGVKSFASGNLDDFDPDAMGIDTGDMEDTSTGMTADMMASLQASLDRNSDVMERAVNEGIKGVFNVYGKGGLVDSYDTGKKTVTRHGEKY